MILHSTPAVVVLVVVAVERRRLVYHTLSGRMLSEGKASSVSPVCDVITVVPGSGNTTGGYKGIRLDVGPKENRL